MTIQVRIGEISHQFERGAGGVTLGGEALEARFEKVGNATGLLLLDGNSYVVSFVREGERIRLTMAGTSFEATVLDETAILLERFGFESSDIGVESEIHAPMPGLVLHVLVEAGQRVEEGEGLIVLEAMKMENELRAPRSGTIASVRVAAGDAVGKNELLIELETQ